MSIYRGLVLEQSRLFRAVRHCHDVHVIEFGARFAPITVSQNVVTSDFAAGFDFPTGRHRPVKKRVESRNAHACL